MEKKKLSEFTDQELLLEAKKMRTTTITNAVLIGFLIGVVIYSVVKSSFGLLTLIPLFLAYKLMNRSNHDKKELETILKDRNLK